jgi:hypothetical protein
VALRFDSWSQAYLIQDGATMRVAVLVVFVSVLTTAAEASKSCMTKTEARQHFGSVHIYWHGRERCWDATPTRRYHRIHKVQKKNNHKVQQKIDHPKWHDSMSEMLPNSMSEVLPDQEPARTPWVDRWVDIAPPQLPIVARWVDIVQVASPPIIERESEPMVTLRSVVMVIIAITLTLAIVEFLSIGMGLAGRTHRRH